MHLGRVRYKWANDFPDDQEPERLLEDAAFSLNEVVGQPDQTAEAEADWAEARYWLAMVELTRAGLGWQKRARNSYPQDLLAPGIRLKDEHLRKTKEHLDELAKAKAASWFRDQAPEWLACLACYRAAAANKPSDPARLATRADALAALKVLAERSPLAAASLRSQFLLTQLEAAKGWAAADELEELWRAFKAGMPDPVPAPQTRQDEFDLLALYLCQYKARAVRITRLQLPAPGDGAKFLDGVLAIGTRDLISKPELLAQLEAAAQALAAQAAGAESDAPKIAPLAAGVFVAAARTDPAHDFVFEKPWDPLASAGWRAYVASVMVGSARDQVAGQPARYMRDLVTADDLFIQAEAILAKHPRQADPAVVGRKKEVRGSRERLENLFRQHLPKAIENVRRDDPKQAVEWQKRLDGLQQKQDP
jgi:hypothetical protein